MSDYDWDAHLERAIRNTLDTIVSGVCPKQDGVDILTMHAKEYHRAKSRKARDAVFMHEGQLGTLACELDVIKELLE